MTLRAYYGAGFELEYLLVFSLKVLNNVQMYAFKKRNTSIPKICAQLHGQ